MLKTGYGWFSWASVTLLSSPQPTHKWKFTYYLPFATDIFLGFCVRFFSHTEGESCAI